MQEKLTVLKEQLANSQKIAFFGGAGVSTASGIPDFRSAEGLFMQENGYTYSAEQIVSNSFYRQHPREFFDYYYENLVYPEAKPNKAHQFLAELETTGKDVSIITQNIDGLHQLAGSSKVFELHGSVLRNHCETCGKSYGLPEIVKDGEGVPRCPLDGGIVRPDVVLYEEGLDQSVVNGAVDSLLQADMLIVAGTSLVVYPAAGLIDYFNGKYFVVINKTPLQVRNQDALVFEATLDEVFGGVKEEEADV